MKAHHWMKNAITPMLSMALLAGMAAAQTSTTTPSNSSSSTTQTQTPTDTGHRRHMGKNHMDRIANQLGLSDDQKAQMKKMHEDQAAQMKALKADTSLTADQRKAKAKEIHQQHMSQMEGMLTPDQKAKWEQMKAAHKGGKGRNHHRKSAATGTTTNQ